MDNMLACTCFLSSIRSASSALQLAPAVRLGFSQEANHFFAGDYIDRGKQSHLRRFAPSHGGSDIPENIFVLGGNHGRTSILSYRL